MINFLETLLWQVEIFSPYCKCVLFAKIFCHDTFKFIYDNKKKQDGDVKSTENLPR